MLYVFKCCTLHVCKVVRRRDGARSQGGHTPLVDQHGGDAVALTALIAKHDARAHGRDLPVLAPRGCPAVGRERAAGSTYASTIYATTRTRHANNKQTNMEPYADLSECSLCAFQVRAKERAAAFTEEKSVPPPGNRSLERGIRISPGEASWTARLIKEIDSLGTELDSGKDQLIGFMREPR